MLVLGGNPNARTSVPQWMLEENGVGVHDEIRNCIAFLGWRNERGGFNVEGTAFFIAFVEEYFSFRYLVTAGHVLWPSRWRVDSKPHANIDVRVSTKGGVPYIGATKIDDWFFHQDKRMDICATPIASPAPGSVNEDAVVTFLRLPEIALIDERLESPGIEVGDEIFMPGAFIGRVGERKNIPIVRTGNICAMPEEPISSGSPKAKAYLIETRSLGGASGSPIFVNTEPFSPLRKPKKPPLSIQYPSGRANMSDAAYVMPYLLVGMILGGHSGQYSSDFLSEADTDIVPKDVDFNAGISVAMTAEDIVDFIINDSGLKKRRLSELIALQKDSGYRPFSAARAKPSLPEEGNPTHREDFTSLLNAAAKTKPQDG